MNQFFPLLLGVAFLTACSQKKDTSKIDKIIAEVSSDFVSDKRVKRFLVSAIRNKESIILKGETNLPNAKKALLEMLENSQIPFLDSIDLLPHSNLNGKHFGIVNISVCNIRYEPKHWAELSTQALLGTELRVHKQEGDWFLVQTPDDYFGWLDAGGFVLMDEEGLEKWRAKPKLVYTEHFGFATRNVDGAEVLISDLVKGNILAMEPLKQWNHKILFPDGRDAFIPKESAVRLESWLGQQDPDAEKIIETAREFLGRPYLWGGTSGKGMDCSGFTKTVYYLNGVQLERDASLQVHTGIEIETDTLTWKNLEAGDLLFFGRSPEEKDKIRHVAIWMGNGKIIHATEMVKIESLIRGEPDFAEWRLLTFARAKRILNSLGENGIIQLKDLPYYQSM